MYAACTYNYLRPHLEYACQFWDPYTSESINILEGVQKFACRVCLGQCCSDFEAMLNRLDIPTLLTRHRYLKLTSSMVTTTFPLVFLRGALFNQQDN